MASRHPSPNVRYRSTRGFVEAIAPDTRTGDPGLFVRKGFKLVDCDGEAHSNPHVDNCGLCMNATWGKRVLREAVVQ